MQPTWPLFERRLEMRMVSTAVAGGSEYDREAARSTTATTHIASETFMLASIRR